MEGIGDVDDRSSDHGGGSAAQRRLADGGHPMTLLEFLGIAAFSIGFVLVAWWLDKHHEMARRRGFT
jgi:hypothetical protein